MSASKQTYYDYQVQQFNDYSDSEWSEMYDQMLVEAEYKAWQIEEAAKAPHMQQEAQQPAVSVADAPTFTEQLTASHNAVQSTLSELNLLLLNVGNSYLRHDIYRIAANLINRSGLLDETKSNYMQMIDAANLSSKQFFNNNMAAA